MQKLDIAMQHEFVDALRGRLLVQRDAGSSHRIRMERLVQGVREASELAAEEASRAGRSAPGLSEELFCALRIRHREANWPAASTMRAWVRGSWNDVLRRALLPPVEGGDALVAQTGGAYTWPEIRSALRECSEFWGARGQRDFSYGDYLSWASLPEVLAKLGRRPRSQRPFDAYGGFLASKRHALSSADASPPHGRSRQVQAGMWRPSSGYGYGHEQLKAAVDEVVRYLGKVPKPGEYIAARKAILDAEAEQGAQPRAFASYNKLVRTWKPWDAVLAACGHRPFKAVDVDAETGRGRHLVADRRVISEEDLLDGIREAFEEKGPPFSKVTYELYIAERRFLSKTGRPMGTYAGIYGRYRHVSRKPWRWVCDLALPEGWNRRPDRRAA